ncbi:MAG: NAD(P)H-hydrate epimerase, partial [Lewinella sp.]|nr:NAD(P)H-hydrate epimerase [Lewinella sp.]
MTKILTARQTQELDRYTIEQEPIASIDLMERAARAFVRWFRRHYPDDTRLVQVFCGPGNNGGDGFAVARLLHDAGYRVSVYACRIGQSQSPDCAINEQRLQDKRVIPVQDIFKDAPWPTLPTGQLIIDGLFGSGLNRPLAGYWGALVEFLNGQRAERIAIDIPSGLFADATTQGIVFRAGRTVSFQLPKLAFLMAENARHVGRWTVVDIGLHPEGLARQDTPYHHLTGEQVARWWRPRQRFDHKGT